MTKWLVGSIILTILFSYQPCQMYYRNKQYQTLFFYIAMAFCVMVILWKQGPGMKSDFKYRTRQIAHLSYTERDELLENKTVYTLSKIISNHVPPTSKLLVVFPENFRDEHSLSDLWYAWFKINYRIYPLRVDYVMEASNQSYLIINNDSLSQDMKITPSKDYLPRYEYVAVMSRNSILELPSFTEVTTTPEGSLYHSQSRVP